MKGLFRNCVLAATFAFVVGATSAKAGGDLAFVDYVEPSHGGCYLRTDAGVAFGTTADASFRFNGQTTATDEDADTGYFIEGGYGCHLASRLRAEVVAGYHFKRHYEADGLNPDIDITEIGHYSFMANFYYDFRKWRRIRPYVGVGLGFSYNVMDEWYQRGTASRVEGGEDLSFAWSLMAGFGYQITPRTTFDFGYRYINFGDVESGRIDSTGAANPPFYYEDMGTHEIKAGLRYQLNPVAYEPVGYPMK